MTTIITDQVAINLARKVNLNLHVVDLKWFKAGLIVELEHNQPNFTNVVHDNLLIVAKITMAHLMEFPDYYQRLKRMEHSADKFWRTHRKPHILLRNN